MGVVWMDLGQRQRRVRQVRSRVASRRSVGLALIVAVAGAIVASPYAFASALNFSGTVDAAGIAWRAYRFDVSAPTNIVATLDWANGSANLNLFLYAPGGRFVKGTGKSTAKPETISHQTSVLGTWTLGVKAASGASAYTLAVQLGATTGGGTGDGTPFVTLLFSRSQWAAHDSCQVAPGSVTLEQVAADLTAKGRNGTSTIVTSQPPTTGLRCVRDGLVPSWPTLERIHRDYRWEYVSHSKTAPDMTKLSASAAYDESCGTLSLLYSHGFDRAWGLFAYPVNRFTDSIQSNIVSTCFAYGRRYVGSRNQRSTMAAPWYANAWSVNGGACNDPSRACYSIQTRFRYVDPSKLASFVRVGAGEWAIIQFYALVTGAKLSGATRWDCTSADWRQHFVSRTELYCWNDYQTVLSAIPSGAVVTDPASVATAWGSNPKVSAAP